MNISENTNTTDDVKENKEELRWIFASICLTISLTGIVGNIFTVGIIIRRKHFHKPTFAVISLLAVADVMGLISRGALAVSELEGYPSFLDMSLMFGAAFTTLTSSNFHVIILSRLRYKMTVHPLESLTISSCDMVKQSVFVWVLCIILGIPIVIIPHIGFTVEIMHVLNYLSCAFVFFTLVIPILTLHCLKVRRLSHGSHTCQRKGMRMSLIVCLIVIIQLFVTGIVAVFTTLFQLGISWRYYSYIEYAVVMLGHSVNPIIYFFLHKCVCSYRTTNTAPDRRTGLQIVNTVVLDDTKL